MIRETADVSPLARLLVERLFVLSRNLAVHGEAHPLVLQNAEALAAAMEAAAPPYAVQFVGQAVFIDRALAVLDPLNFSRANKLARALSALKINEIRVEWAPAPGQLVALARALGTRGATAPTVDGLHLREIRGARGGNAGEAVEPELFASAQMVRALIEAESLEAALDRGWNWSHGISVVRRVERARQVDYAACVRFLDHAPGARTVARRGTGAVLSALAMAAAAGLPTALGRIAAHVALALALQGLSERDGASVVEAVETALPRLLESVLGGGTSMDPHRQRVCAALHSVASRIDEPARWNPLARAAALAYDLERLRCPLGSAFDHPSLDLLAWAARTSGRAHDPRWVRALLAAHGVLPPNARVTLADGRAGVVLGGAEDEAPLLPLVYLKGDGVVALPDEPVRFERTTE